MKPFSPEFDAALVESRARRELLANARQKSGAPFPFDQVGSIAAGLSGPALRRPYEQSVWVRSAIEHISGPIAGLDLDFVHDGQETPVEDLKLTAFWKRPARRLNGRAEFVQASVGWRKLAGESFWLLDDSFFVPFPEAAQSWAPLIVARPQSMRHVVADGELTGWEYIDAAGRRWLLTPEQVIQSKQWNPHCEWRGLGNYEAARIDVETALGNARFLKALSESNGDQGVYVVAKNGLPDDTQKKQIVAQLREKRTLQQQGIFKPIFLTGDIAVQDPQVRSADAAFFQGQMLSAEAIYIAFGVPPSMSAKAASYSIGSASDYYRLLMDTCIPESSALAEGVAAISSRILGTPVSAAWDWDEHPVMQEVRKERLSSADGLWAKGMPMEKVSAYLGLGLPRYAGDNKGYLPFSVAPVEAADIAPERQPQNQETGDTTDPVTEMLTVLRQPRQRAKAAPVCQRVSADEAKLWRSHMVSRRATEKSYASAFTRVLFDARAEVLRKLENHATAGRSKSPHKAPESSQGSQTASQSGGEAFNRELTGTESTVKTRAGAIDFLFDLAKFSEGLKTAFRGITQGGLNTAGKQLFTELGKDDPFVYPPARAIQFIRSRENLLSDVAQEAFDRIKAVLEDGITAGDSTEQLAKMVRGEFNDLSQSRSLTIASTETSAMYGVARQEGMAQAGVKWKQWLTSGADNVREAHKEANRQIVAVDDYFTVGGEQLSHPGDPHGSAGNVINCHCVSVASAKGPEEEA